MKDVIQELLGTDALPSHSDSKALCINVLSPAASATILTILSEELARLVTSVPAPSPKVVRQASHTIRKIEKGTDLL